MKQKLPSHLASVAASMVFAFTQRFGPSSGIAREAPLPKSLAEGGFKAQYQNALCDRYSSLHSRKALYTKDSLRCIVTPKSADGSWMRPEFASDELKDAEAVALRIVEDMDEERHGWGGLEAVCRRSKAAGADLSTAQQQGIANQLDGLNLGNTDDLSFITLSTGSTLIQNADGDVAGEIQQGADGQTRVNATRINADGSAEPAVVYIDAQGQALTDQQLTQSQAQQTSAALGLLNSIIGLQNWDAMSDLQRTAALAGIFYDADRVSIGPSAGGFMGDKPALVSQHEELAKNLRCSESIPSQPNRSKKGRTVAAISDRSFSPNEGMDVRRVLACLFLKMLMIMVPISFANAHEAKPASAAADVEAKYQNCPRGYYNGPRPGKDRYTKDNFLWVVTPQFAADFCMPAELVSDQLRGAEAVAFRIVENKDAEYCGWGGKEEVCASAKELRFEIYLESGLLPKEQEITHYAQVNHPSQYLISISPGERHRSLEFKRSKTFPGLISPFSNQFGLVGVQGGKVVWPIVTLWTKNYSQGTWQGMDYLAVEGTTGFFTNPRMEKLGVNKFVIVVRSPSDAQRSHDRPLTDFAHFIELPEAFTAKVRLADKTRGTSIEALGRAAFGMPPAPAASQSK